MEYGLLALSLVFASANTLLLRKFKSRTFRSTGDAFFFNGGVSLMWIAVMAVWIFLSGGLAISPLSVLFGAVYGVILCLFLFFKTEALASGPLSLTTLINSCAFIIATGFGVVYANEQVSVSQAVGMALILLSVVLCISPGKGAEKLSGKWFFYCFSLFFAGGLVGIFYKVFGKSAAANEVNAMMLSASVTSCALFFLAGLLISRTKGEPTPAIARGALPYVLLSGVAGCIYIRMNVSLSAIIPSAVFFPVFNGALVMISTAAGGMVFGEKLTRIQLAGIILGLIAIVINGCGDVLLAML